MWWGVLLPFGTYVLVTLTILNQIAALNTTDILAPEVCFTHEDCNENFYCVFKEYVTVYNKKPGICAPRLKKGDSCVPYNIYSCEEGLECFSYVGFGAHTCVPKLMEGARCRRHSVPRGQSCGAGLHCPKESADRICRPLISDGEDTSCGRDSDCDYSAGLACNYNTWRCEKRKQNGAKCTPPIPNTEIHFKYSPPRIRNSDCMDFCRPLPAYPRGDNGTCVARPRIGEKCTAELPCWNESPVPLYRENLRSCNHGRCASNSMIKKRLGDDCDTEFDTCDERRGLSCLFSALRGRAVCQQRAEMSRFCTPRSPFSRCVGVDYENNPLVCRVRGAHLTSTSWTSNEHQFLTCASPLRPVKPGFPCASERDQCTDGSMCRAVPYYKKHKKDEKQYACMRLLPSGADCTSKKTTTMCGDGLVCGKGGKCERGDVSFKGPYIRIGSFADCTGRIPCMPGLVCIDAPRYISWNAAKGPICDYLKTRVGVGQLCGAYSTQCKPGLYCNGLRPSRCYRR